MHEEKKPTFNVTIPFERVTTVQMNRTMSSSLAKFLFDFEDIEAEIYALAEHLRDPGSWYRRATGAAFSVDNFGDVVNLQINQEMLDMLVDYLEDAANDTEVVIFALGRALKDPVKCSELRLKKIRQRDESDDRQFNGPRRKTDREPVHS